MAENSKIAWTTHTFNPWIGCTKVSEGCTHCYAETLAHRYKWPVWGPTATRRPTTTSYWRQLDRWDRQAEKAGVNARVFCGSLCDIFEDRALLEPWRADLFTEIAGHPHLTWLLLTKRPENIYRMIGTAVDDDPFYWLKTNPHVWLGTTVENQDVAARRLLPLLTLPAAVHFVSAEPLVGHLDLHHITLPGDGELDAYTGRFFDGDCPPSLGRIDWLIVGGESGHGARPMHPAWPQELQRECQLHGIPFFFKQWGEWAPYIWQPKIVTNQLHFFDAGKPGSVGVERVGVKAAGHLLNGVEYHEFPH